MDGAAVARISHVIIFGLPVRFGLSEGANNKCPYSSGQSR